jgi:glycosyltransferase involved in cell wall biosynthesis
MNQNKISIVTVVYNAEDHIEQTINSIINQTYQNIEYVIVDGGSTDKTLDIIKNYDKHISLWISEKDNGIYDAMNKALNLITGDYVWFMNAGDEIYSKTTVEEIFKDFPNEDVFYGKTQLIKQDGNVLKITTTPQSLNWKSFQFGMVVSHQSIIFKSSLISKYDLSYKIVSDQDWIINNLKKSKNIKNTNQVLSKFT